MAYRPPPDNPNQSPDNVFYVLGPNGRIFAIPREHLPKVMKGIATDFEDPQEE